MAAKGKALGGVFGKMLEPVLKTVKRADTPTPHPRAPHPRPARPPGTPPTRTDRIKEHVTDRDLQAARTELNGGVVKYKDANKTIPWDHVAEVRDAQNGLSKRIATLKKQLSMPTLTTADRAEKQRELAEASRILDHTRKYVP